MSERIDLILFDLDDTLYSHHAAVAGGLAAQLGQSPAQAEAAYQRWTELEDLHYNRYLRGECEFQEMRRVRVREFLADSRPALSDDDADEWFADYFQHYADHWIVGPDSVGTLAALRAANPAARFGIITNGELGLQQRKIEVLGLTHQFEHVIASGAVGVAKPHAQIFRIACETFGIPAARAVYIGDRPLVDAVGAADAGLTGIWFNDAGRILDREDRALLTTAGVIEITSMRELPGVLYGVSA